MFLSSIAFEMDNSFGLLNPYGRIVLKVKALMNLASYFPILDLSRYI
jgi:hypothetical protein